MDRRVDMLLRIVSGQNVTQLDAIVVGRIVDVNVKIAAVNALVPFDLEAAW